MASTDFPALERQARLRYEWARGRRALLGLTPVLLVIAVTATVGRHPSATGAFGAAVFLAGAVMLWYGRAPKRAVLPGVLAGLVPLALALCSSCMHGCAGNCCMTICLPACAVGGLVAGAAVARVGHQRKAGAVFWLSASALALLTGAMGCSCMGYLGVVGLAAGFTVGVAPELLRRTLASGA